MMKESDYNLVVASQSTGEFMREDNELVDAVHRKFMDWSRFVTQGVLKRNPGLYGNTADWVGIYELEPPHDPEKKPIDITGQGGFFKSADDYRNAVADIITKRAALDTQPRTSFVRPVTRDLLKK